MKYLHLLFTATALLFLAASCNKDEQKQGSETPVIETQTVLEIAENGGYAELPYTILNGDGQSTLTATCQSEWISDINVSTDKVSFTASTNETGEKRTCELLLEYPGAENVTVTLSQNSIEIVHSFAFEVLEVNYINATVKVTPNDASMTFLSLPISMEEYKEMASDEDVVKYIVNHFSAYGDITEFMLSGEQNMTASNLFFDTEYVIAAFGYDGTQALTRVDTVAFTTKAAPDPSVVKFTINITEITGTSVTVRFTPDPECYRYAVAAVKASDNEAFGTDLEKWTGYVKGMADRFIENGSISSYDDYVYSACRTSEFYVKIEDLDYDTEYYAAAILVDEHLNVIAAPYLSEKFETPAKPSLDPVITLTMTEYFDGTAIAEAYPEFASFSGKAIVPVTGTFENSSYWVAGSMDKSMYDMYYGNNYLEIALVDMNMCYEKIYSDDYPESPFTHFFAISWNKDVMITSIAYNDSTKASKSDFSTVSVTTDQNNVADISEFAKYL